MRPLVGVTIDKGAYHVTTFSEAAQILNGYVGSPLATRFEKIYLKHGEFSLNEKLTELIPTGCSFLISVKPSTSLVASQQKALAGLLSKLKAMGVKFRVALYSEPNDKAFATPAEWLPYWRFYAPVILAAGIPLVYEPGCGPTAYARGIALFPSNPAPTEVWLDYYASAYGLGSRIDTLLSLAHQRRIKVGIGEWGWTAGNSSGTGHPMTMPIFTQYGNYLLSQIHAGKIQLGAAYYSAAFGTLTANVITSAQDPRIPMIKKIAAAL